MNPVQRRVAKLEATMRPTGCRRCDGKYIGVKFTVEGPETYAPYPDGAPGPLPPHCPACKRRMPKLYIMHDRSSWDGICRGGL